MEMAVAGDSGGGDVYDTGKDLSEYLQRVWRKV